MGRVRQWSIWTEKVNDSLTYIYTEDGLQGGKLKGTKTPITQGLGKNSVEEQAIFDAQSVVNKKVKQGYGLDVTNLKSKGETLTIKAPMKAETLSLEKGKKNSLDKYGLRNKEVYIDRKLDGWRFRIKVNNDGIVFYTSSGDETLGFPQISEPIQKVFNKNFKYWNNKYGITEHILDGEIFSKELGFQATASACGSVKNITAEKQMLRDKMQFHIFDVVIDDMNVGFQTRKKIIEYYIDNEFILPVERYKIIATEENIQKYMTQFLNEGNEGLMLKTLNHPYEFKRSKNIFKFKPSMDAEFQIIGFKESISGGTLGSFICKMETGETFSATPMDKFGTNEMKKEIWDNQNDYIGKWITCVFMEYTEAGVPRHPRAKSFRKGKSKD